MVHFLYGEIIREVGIFRELPTHTITQICSKLKSTIYVAGQKICREGDFGGDLFIIIDGQVHFTKEDGSICRPRYRGKGGCFGELPIVVEALREMGKCLQVTGLE
eukprot:SAG31_NODE_19020_length_614_cov_1.194175_1_plen_104_part_10